MNKVGSSGAIAMSVSAVVIVLLLVFTDTGKMFVKSFFNSSENKQPVNIQKIEITNKIAIENLTIRTQEKFNSNLAALSKQLDILSEDIEKYEKRNSFVQISAIEKLKYKQEVLERAIARQDKIQRMNNNSQKIIKVGVENVGKFNLFYKNIDYKREFFLAQLDKLKAELSDAFLSNIETKESRKIYAQLTMIKSISHYLDYEPDKAYTTYIKAKKAYPGLKVIQDLEKEYMDIYPSGAKELKYAYVLVASVAKTKENMEKTADRILSPSQAHNFRKLEYSLYLSINQTKIRVYTIFEYHSDLERDQKLREIEGIERTSQIYRTTKELPVEYIFQETRKKIYVFNTSGRNDDKNLVKRFKNKKIKYVEAKGKWSKKFDVYAIYYDGNSYDKNDLNKILEITRNIIGSYTVKPFAYQQSKGKAIRDLFKNKSLKYVIILEKNAYIR